jgi:hypothetical protein
VFNLVAGIADAVLSTALSQALEFLNQTKQIRPISSLVDQRFGYFSFLLWLADVLSLIVHIVAQKKIFYYIINLIQKTSDESVIELFSFCFLFFVFLILCGLDHIHQYRWSNSTERCQSITIETDSILKENVEIFSNLQKTLKMFSGPLYTIYIVQ